MAVFRHLAKAMPGHHAEHKHTHACGKKLCFHGSFLDKSLAVQKEKETPGGFIIDHERGGETYYLVVSKRGK